MISNKRIFAPTLAIILASCLFAWVAIIEHWLIFGLSSFLAWLASIYWLVSRLKGPEKELQKILQTTKNGDYSFALPSEQSTTLYDILSIWSKQLREQSNKRQKADLKNEQILNQVNAHLLILDVEGNLKALNHYENGLPGMRDHLNARDWPEIFPFLKRFTDEDVAEKDIVLLQDGEKQKWRIQQHALGFEPHKERLITITNEQELFEKHENQALEKILHVLTHEIMNSVSPISSLADTLQHHLQLKENNDGKYLIEEEQYHDLLSTAGIMQRRTAGLMSFVERYARFARLPRVKKTAFDWLPFLEDLEKLCAQDLEKAQVKLELITLQASRKLHADKDLMTQVLLNLIKNSIESMEDLAREGAKISISIDQGDGYHYLKVMDEGKLIDEELVDQIFLPFFSTKKRGSGIGLSLSRKIIMAHGGRLYLQQKANYKAFSIELPF